MNRMSKLKIGVVGLAGRWSTELLADSVQAKTGNRTIINLSKIILNTLDAKVFHQEYDLLEFDALIIKKAGEEYSPDILDRLEILRYLEEKGVRMFSSPTKILRLINRASCTVTLAANNIPMPPTVITEDENQALAAIEKFGEAVLKPLYSTKARGMHAVSAGSGALERLKSFHEEGNRIFYVQKKLDIKGRDMGVVFIGGRFIQAYARIGAPGSWNTTIYHGGHYEACKPSDNIMKVVQTAQKLFGLDYTCVDIAETEKGPVVFEVSAFGGFKGLFTAYGINAGDMLVEHVLKRIKTDDKA